MAIGNPVLLDGAVAAAFGVDREAVLLAGGEGRTYRAGDVVLRREDDPVEAAWVADLFNQIRPDGFRVPRPVQARDGGWIASGEWSAWAFVEGRPATRQDAPEVARAIDAFHAALASVPCPEHLARRDLPYDRADRWAWGELPPDAHPRLVEPLRRLAAVRRPLAGLRDQLIHGDLNPENVLVAPGLPPAIIDMAPYRRPAPFGAAVAAFWLGPWQSDESVLACFAHVPHLDQLLVRACIRMLLSMQELGYLHALERYRAAMDIICRRAGG